MGKGDQHYFQIDNFANNISLSWKNLQAGEDFCDVTLVCEDTTILSHKVVISSFSPIFRNILKQHNDPHPVIFLQGIEYTNLEYLLCFMYEGQVDIDKEELNSLISVAEDLRIKGLCSEDTNLDDNFITNFKHKRRNRKVHEVKTSQIKIENMTQNS